MGIHDRAMRDAAIQHAIKWISDRLQEEPNSDHSDLIDRASREFGLSPIQEHFLYHQFGKGI